MGGFIFISIVFFLIYKLWKPILGKSSAKKNNSKSSYSPKGIFINKVSFSGSNPSYWDYKVDGEYISYRSHGGSGAIIYNLNMTFNEEGNVYFKSQDESNFHYLGKVKDCVQQFSRFPGENILMLKPN